VPFQKIDKHYLLFSVQKKKYATASQSLLWNLYLRETAPAQKKVSLLFGLFQHQSTEQTEQTRLSYFTVFQTPSKR
jgi:hypothetical protein